MEQAFLFGAELAPIAAEGVEISAARQLQTLGSPKVVKTIHEWPHERPCGGQIEPTKTDQPIRLSKHGHVDQHSSISADGMNASHRLAITDARPSLRRVVGGVDVDKCETFASISTTQKGDFAKAEWTAPVVKHGQFRLRSGHSRPKNVGRF